MFDADNSYHHVFRLYGKNNGVLLTDVMDIYTLELEKLPETAGSGEKEGELLDWLPAETVRKYTGLDENSMHLNPGKERVMMSLSKDGKKTKAAKRLDELGISYEYIRYSVDSGNLSAEHAADDMDLPYEVIYKTLVLRGDKTGVLEACIPAGFDLDTEVLAQLSGNGKVAMVNKNELFVLTGYVMGGCSPIKSGRQYPVYIHEDATNHEKIAINAGERGLMFFMSPNDIRKAVKVQFGNIARKKPEAV
jgi:Cys-tRNA(Pro)/Cys-tRNA(Cys) deacylase